MNLPIDQKKGIKLQIIRFTSEKAGSITNNIPVWQDSPKGVIVALTIQWLSTAL